MSYIVLNGVKSTLIQGLLISSLPPITKPSIRTSIETIDGRDGDIVTKLGYSAYDKTMSIGLFGDYDINEVINYFNSEGTVIFSNEPDKFYQYQILNQIDFEKLINFKTATVTFHVQPFKYSAVDDKVTFRRNLLSPKPYSITKSGITVSVVNGQISISGTAEVDTQIYIPIEPIFIEETHRTGGSSRYMVNWTGGSLEDIGTAFDFRIIGDKPIDSDSFGGQAYSLTYRSGGATVFETEKKTYNYLWIMVPQGKTLSFPDNYPRVMLLDMEFDQHLIFNNAGNVEAKPIITLHDMYGLLTLIFNGDQTVTIDFDDGVLRPRQITIDLETMNAYYDGTLLNRKISGDLSKISFKTGENVISRTGSGTFDWITVEKESRWI